MEIKINKEIRTYKETIFFGLSLRQFICSVLAVGMAVFIYFAFHDVLGRETVSWVCIVSAAPIAVAGFFQYNGLTVFLMSGRRVWKSENYYLNELTRGEKK